MWGIHSIPTDLHGPARFIPTRVGNTMAQLPGQKSRPVHPHACGEYWQICLAPRLGGGSSPRVWGILWQSQRSSGRPRFIPTRVGNTAVQQRRAAGIPVHPHACGEYREREVAEMSRSGSSPRVWGIRDLTRRRARCSRFIPTRVGNTTHTAGSARTTSVHPHACGEYCMLVLKTVRENGSSPRVWGIRDTPKTEGGVTRFIPTRVGNTPRPCPHWWS